MRELYYLTRRNMLVFLRDRAAVFFSVLAMLIVLMLMVVFLGDMNSDNIVGVLAEYGGERDRAADRENAERLVQMWTLAGILVVNAVTVALTVMQTMIQDETKGALSGFYTAPVSRGKVALGYILAAFIVGVGMCLLTLLIGEGYMVICGYPLLSLSDCLQLVWMIVLNVFVYASFAYLLALFIHSESAWGGMLTVIGTLVGFVGVVYLPMGMLPEGICKVLKVLPVLPGAAMMRVVCTKEAIADTFAGLPDAVAEGFREQMGIDIIVGGKCVSLIQQVLFLLTYAIIAIVIAILISRKRRMK